MTDYRVINKSGKHYPQYRKSKKWINIERNNSIWDDYAGIDTPDNAKQRLYVYMGSLIKPDRLGGISPAHTIFEVAEKGKSKYFSYISLIAKKDEVLEAYEKYKGRTEFLKNLFPRYFLRLTKKNNMSKSTEEHNSTKNIFWTKSFRDMALWQKCISLSLWIMVVVFWYLTCSLILIGLLALMIYGP